MIRLVTSIRIVALTTTNKWPVEIQVTRPARSNHCHYLDDWKDSLVNLETIARSHIQKFKAYLSDRNGWSGEIMLLVLHAKLRALNFTIYITSEFQHWCNKQTNPCQKQNSKIRLRSYGGRGWLWFYRLYGKYANTPIRAQMEANALVCHLSSGRWEDCDKGEDQRGTDANATGIDSLHLAQCFNLCCTSKIKVYELT